MGIQKRTRNKPSVSPIERNSIREHSIIE